eukprot:TRINITY_DN12607_c0_g1_i1.p1 TRINITY_DN12607_c0_g1~~TRINITY_DN12607_c0_g1_i1.p1  ORF type:complete len:413 (+),score=50.78 TRINITY_DN12607_c0_g1_i1:59-1240(+)
MIIQCFDVPLKELTQRLESIHNQGFTDIELSPMQTHCSHLPKWYRLYQPCGTKIGNSIGSKTDLEKFIQNCNKHSLGVIIDIVLHHTTGCPVCNPTGTYRWFRTFLKNKFFGQQHHGSRFNCHDFGPRVDTDSKSVFKEQLAMLQTLVDMGVAGFRFDAAKHISPQYLRKLLDGLRSDRFLLCYGECLDGSPEICSEYISDGSPPMMAMDFPMVFRLIHAMGYDGDLRTLQEFTIPHHRSIAMADCHDSKIGDSYHFGDDRDGILAISFLLGRGAGIPLVWAPFANDPQVLSGIQFFRQCQGMDFRFHSGCTSNILIIMRGDSGFFILNKSNEWMEREALSLPGMRCGSYRELIFNFEIGVGLGQDGSAWVDNWDGHGGFKIGPRQILFFCHT